MRIVAGRHRGRRLAAPGGGARPTADRTREALFNILAHAAFAGGADWRLAGARVLDAFAGSGALGLEALSRGAAHATFMDTATASLAAIRRNVEMLGESARCALLKVDPLHPPPAAEPCDLVLMDPPYESGLAAPAVAALAATGWIAPYAVCVVELAKGEELAPVNGFTQADARVYGATRVVFLTAGG